ncbi:MAG: hypothetical protein PHQ64_04390, partial [Bacilli bacterium]|nr:hypothetical protein [Bacilli bacterium]
NKINDIKLRKINEDESDLEYLKYLKEKCFEISKPEPRNRKTNETDSEYTSYLEKYYNDFYKRQELLEEIVPLLANYETEREEKKRIRRENNIYRPSLIQRFHANRIVRKGKKILKTLKKLPGVIKNTTKKIANKISSLKNNKKFNIKKNIVTLVKKPFVYFIEKKKEKKRLEEEFINLINRNKASDLLNGLEEEVIEEENKDILDDLYEEEYEEIIEEKDILSDLYEEEIDLEDKIIKTTEKDLLDLEEETITESKNKRLVLSR